MRELQECVKGVCLKFKECFKEVSSVFQGSLREISRMFKKFLRVFQLRFRGVSSSFHGAQGFLKEVEKVCPGSFNGV